MDPVILIRMRDASKRLFSDCSDNLDPAVFYLALSQAISYAQEVVLDHTTA